MENGAPRDKVDLLLLGDGYTAAETEKWHRDARRMAATLFAAPPFKEHRAQFNVWALDTPSAQLTTLSVPSATFLRSTTGACDGSRLPRPTSSWKSW
jgi:hypothetical protein